MMLFGAKKSWAVTVIAYIFGAAVFVVFLFQVAYAQGLKVSSVLVEGNRRIETATIQAFSGIEPGDVLSAGDINDAIQHVRDSELFSSVSADITGPVLTLIVAEFPTVNAVVFEGNNILDVSQLESVVRTSPRRVYSISQVSDDTNSIAAAYSNKGHISASIEPRIIRRSDNRVDVIFEIIEGGIVEIERISFVGNRNFSDGRLRRILGTSRRVFSGY